MSAQKKACKLSMPNTDTISSTIYVNPDTSLFIINAKNGHHLCQLSMSAQKQTCKRSMSNRTLSRQLSMPNTGTISSAINVSPDTSLSTCSLKCGTNYSLTIIKAESIPANVFEVSMLQINQRSYKFYVVIYNT